MLRRQRSRQLGRSLAVPLFVALLGSACSNENPTPIDFSSDGTTATTAHSDSDSTSPHLDGEDPNEAQRSMVFGLAEQQCLDDLEADEGIIQIALPDTGEVVNEVSVPCDEVRARAEAGEPAGVEIIPEELRPGTGG